MFSVILHVLRQTVGHRASPLLFPSFSPSYCDVSEAISYFASTILLSHSTLPVIVVGG
jgi:hypothetical protein